jgi:glycerate 2-kinase
MQLYSRTCVSILKLTRMYVKNAEELISRGRSERERLARELCISALEAALKAADPKPMVVRAVKLSGNILSVKGSKFDLKKFRRILVLGGGKASASMAAALESILGGRISAGAINVPEGLMGKHSTERIELHPATHPLPSQKGVAGVQRMLDLVGRPSSDTLVICLISGGGSALMPLPREGMSLAEKAEVTKLLLNAGATIQELNIVRKHLSGIKGGWLAKRLYPSTVVALVVSDVVGDALDSIASGPLYPDTSTFQDALNVLRKFQLEAKAPENVMTILKKGAAGRLAETPKPGDTCFERIHHFVIGSNRIACMGAHRRLASAGKNPVFLTSRLEGEARTIGSVFGKIVGEEAYRGGPGSFIAGGETTVNVRGSGKGGRNQEAALAALREVDATRGLAVALAGSDGMDGSSDAAGALIDSSTLARARSAGLDPDEYLGRNDSYSFFKKTGDLIMTGPTGTNVNDIWLSVRC